MIDDDTTPSERIEDSIKSPYPTEGDKWSALIEALASEFKEHEAALEEARSSKFVDEATEAQLEKLADFFELDRQTDESLEEFRARIKVALRTQTTSATLAEIREMIAVLMDIDPTTIELLEPDDEVLWLEPRIPANAVGESNVRPNFLDELLIQVSAAGVNANSVLLASAGQIRVLGGSVTSADLGLFDFVGRDAFDGQGAFGAGGDDDVRGATVLEAGSIRATGDPVTSTETEDSGFGSSAFGTGSFDGVTDDDDDVRGATVLEAGSIRATGDPVTSTETTAAGFGSGSFDGSGTFDGS